MSCIYCVAGAVFSNTRPSYHVTEFFEGHERDHVLCTDKLFPPKDRQVWRRALERIRDASVPDQPAASGDEEHVWLMKHISSLRRLADEALRGGNSNA